MLTGIVSWFDKYKGYGVIKSDNKEYFVHSSELYGPLKPLEQVKFKPLMKKNKLCAINIKKIKKINTENYNPSHELMDMRILTLSKNDNLNNYELTERDVIVIPNFFENLYDNLMSEINTSKIKKDNLFKLWHGDNHLIVDDKIEWKKYCPTFNYVLETIKIFFNMNIQATRFNLYENSEQWKPYHHDAAAIKPHIAKKQNITVGISFGAEREIAFEHAKTKTKISFPLYTGTVYAFSKDVNIQWRHGIPQLPPNKKHDKGRISIIAWGK